MVMAGGRGGDVRGRCPGGRGELPGGGIPGGRCPVTLTSYPAIVHEEERMWGPFVSSLANFTLNYSVVFSFSLNVRMLLFYR